MSADSAGKTGCQNQGGIAVAPSLCGLGLFLSMNVARTLGGSLRAENLQSGGARVTITLSMNELSMPETVTEVPHGH